jgi:hypothetical protein
MGCDGGTIPKREELVRTKKNKEKNAKEIENAAKWNNCHLSQENLQTPIVTDMMGYLYNKDTLIEYLLERSKYEAGPSYIKTLKDVKELNLTPNPGYKANQSENGDNFCDLNRSRWICPITGLEMNGIYKFYANFSCGCVIADRAFKTMQSKETTCLKCDKKYSRELDLIVLNASDEDLLGNQEKLKKKRELKASKSSHKSSTASLSSKSTTISIDEEKNTTTIEATTSKVPVKRAHTHVDSKKTELKELETQAKKTKSIQNDPNASKVYKSLFNTSDKAKQQSKAHWVTFNPQYF